MLKQFIILFSSTRKYVILQISRDMHIRWDRAIRFDIPAFAAIEPTETGKRQLWNADFASRCKIRIRKRTWYIGTYRPWCPGDDVKKYIVTKTSLVRIIEDTPPWYDVADGKIGAFMGSEFHRRFYHASPTTSPRFDSGQDTDETISMRVVNTRENIEERAHGASGSWRIARWGSHGDWQIDFCLLLRRAGPRCCIYLTLLEIPYLMLDYDDYLA